MHVGKISKWTCLRRWASHSMFGLSSSRLVSSFEQLLHICRGWLRFSLYKVEPQKFIGSHSECAFLQVSIMLYCRIRLSIPLRCWSWDTSWLDFTIMSSMYTSSASPISYTKTIFIILWYVISTFFNSKGITWLAYSIMNVVFFLSGPNIIFQNFINMIDIKNIIYTNIISQIHDLALALTFYFIFVLYIFLIL